MLLPWIGLCAVVALAVGYGYDYGYQEYGSREECRKLKHYDVDSTNDGRLNRKAKFTHLERHGKHYTMITCPNDSFMYTLVAEHEGSVFNIFGANYQNTVVLAAGFNVGVAAKCDGKRTTVTTTDGKKIKIKKVACIQSSATTPTTTIATTTINPCTLCDIRTIEPSSTPAGIIFKKTETTEPGECRQYSVTCKRDDTQVCTEASISAPTAMGNSQMGYHTGAGLTETKSVTLDCQADGKWKSGFETIVSKVQCKFVGCAEPPSCTDCNTNTITPTSTPDGSIFDSSEIAGSCKKYTVNCRRTDNQVCTEVVMKAPTAMGLTTIASATASAVTQTSTTVDCKADGTWASGTAVITGSLQCSFTGCAPPPSCTDCLIASLEPTPIPGITYNAVETTPSGGGCKRYQLVCARNDNQLCTEVSIIALTARGNQMFGYQAGPGLTQAQLTVECQTNGNWKGGDITLLSNVQCEFDGCAPPPSCTNCDINSIGPTSTPAGIVYEAVETTAPDGCKKYTVTCKRTDNQVCTEASVYAPTSRGNARIGSTNGGSQASATVECQTNGGWKSAGTTITSNLYCEFVGCAPPPSCTDCKIDTIKPISTPDGSIFDSIVIGGSCKKYTVTCKRSDNQVCTEVVIKAQTVMGLTTIGAVTAPGVTQTSTTVDCNSDGKWASGTTEATQPGGCTKYTLTCVRNDNQVCTEVSISAPTGSGNQKFGYQAGSGLTQAKMAVECQTNGNWKSGDMTISSNVQCEFVGCAVPPSCKDCDIKTITPSSLPVGTNFVPTLIPSTCVQYGIVCKRTDNQVCSAVQIKATTPAGPIIVSQNGGSVTFTSSAAQCSASGVWGIGAFSPVTALECIFEGCAVPPSCTSCDFNLLKPLSTPEGVIFEEEKIIGSCNKYRLTCKRIDGKVCTEAYIVAWTTWGGGARIGYASGSGLTQSTDVLDCLGNGRWGVYDETIVSNLECVFNGCQ